MDADIKQKLIEIVGMDNFTDAVIDLVSYAYDASDNRRRPQAAVWPATADQVSRILALANEQRFAVTPRGAGTGLAGAAVPAVGGLVLDLCRMNRIVEIRIDDRLAVVQPGVVYEDLDKALAPHGFFFPPDPASGRVCTIGGNVATNAGGLRGAKYGVTRDYVLALEVVLPDGRRMRTGSDCMKSASGYDLARLFVGSEGTLGIFTEITLKICPKPKAFKTSLASFGTLADAGSAVSGISRAGIVPCVLEVLDRNSLEVLRTRLGMDLPQVEAMLLVETDGYTEAEAAYQMDAIIEVFRKYHAIRIQTADSPEEAAELWRARKSVGSAAAQLRASNLSEDVTVPLSRVPETLEAIAAIVRQYELPFVIFGHAGDGNLHPKIMFDPTDPRQVRGVEDAAARMFEITCRQGGTLTGEHGIGLAKAPFMGLEHDPVALDLMRSLKRLLDPNDILNPGKMALDG